MEDFFNVLSAPAIPMCWSLTYLTSHPNVLISHLPHPRKLWIFTFLWNWKKKKMLSDSITSSRSMFLNSSSQVPPAGHVFRLAINYYSHFIWGESWKPDLLVGTWLELRNIDYRGPHALIGWQWTDFFRGIWSYRGATTYRGSNN